MAWIAFASVPAMLVVMLVMGQLEARLLPRNPPAPPGSPPDDSQGNLPWRGYGDGGRADAGPHWEIPAPPVPEVKGGPGLDDRGTMVGSREEAGS